MATVRYLVSDVDRAVAFYTGHLGFTLIEQMGPAFAMLKRDDLTLWVAGPHASASKPMPDGAQPVPGGWNRIVIEVEDLESLVNQLREAGIHFRNDILNGVGGKQILVEDSEGNPIELFELR